MKIKHIALTTLTVFAMLLIAACGDKYLLDTPNVDATGARVKFVNTCSNCPSVNVKVGGKIVTGVGLGYNGTFPNIGYAVYPPGEISYEFVRADSGMLVLGGKVSAADEKYYTVFINDTVPTQTAFVTEDDIFAAREDTASRIRFVHGLTGKVKDTLDVVRKIDSKIVFSGITFGKSTPFVVNQGNTPDSFFIRKAGSTTAYPGLGSVITTWAKGRTYTIYARGVSGKTGTQAPGMTFYTNR
jgi:Domain of unknown function (DUF4397)